MTHLVEMLRARAAERQDRRAFAFLAEGTAETETLTYAQLDARARAIAVALTERGAAGERVLLLYPPGLEFIAAFFGCVYAGAVAVPCYPPRPNREQPRLRAIACDCRPAFALGSRAVVEGRETLVERVPEMAAAVWLATEDLALSSGARWSAPAIAAGTPAFLQYTSGSTALPKGVIVAHGNILHNEAMIRAAFGQSEASVVVGWLPLYHDMGLIGNVLQPLYAGATAVLMPPVAFLQRPVRWLEAISRYRATTSGGPNFAYDLCVRKVTPERVAGLDLTSWTVAFNGAEPVRAETLDRFAAAFAPCGFRRSAFYPCYGLAEATLFVAGGRLGLPVVDRFAAAALNHGEARWADAETAGRTLVSCGHAWGGQRVVIADPDTGKPVAPGRIGEICVSGPSVTAGYWNRPQETAHAFDGSFLRTGDLGFLRLGELFVTGRIKDLIILRGRNHAPQDLELTAERAHSEIEAAGCAAFSVDVQDEERLVIACETGRRFARSGVSTVIRTSEVAAAVRAAVAREHEVQVYEVVLLRTGTLPRTSSGKVQRHACRKGWLDGSLEIVGRDALGGPAVAAEPAREEPVAAVDAAVDDRAARIAAVERLILDEMAQATGGASIDPAAPPAAAGLDSLTAVDLSHRIETRLGVAVPLTRWLEARTPAEIAVEIVDRIADGVTAEPPGAVEPERSLTKSGEVPLSAGQQGLWYLERLAPEAAAYNIPLELRVRGALDVAALERSLRVLVERHAVLRTTFRVGGRGNRWR